MSRQDSNTPCWEQGSIACIPLRLAPSGVATGGRREEIHIWNPASSAFTRLIRLENNVVLALAYSRHGR
ncbi:MAG: hypothetical protein U0935_19475 [Pirellulales bacterium]